MGRLPFWVVVGVISGVMLLFFLQSEWRRLSGPDDPIQREFLLFTYLVGVGAAYVFVRAALTVAAELRERRRRRTRELPD